MKFLFQSLLNIIFVKGDSSYSIELQIDITTMRNYAGEGKVHTAKRAGKAWTRDGDVFVCGNSEYISFAISIYEEGYVVHLIVMFLLSHFVNSKNYIIASALVERKQRKQFSYDNGKVVTFDGTTQLGGVFEVQKQQLLPRVVEDLRNCITE